MNDKAASTGKYLNSGNGVSLNVLDINHAKYTALVSPDTAFWALVAKDELAGKIADTTFISSIKEKQADMQAEMDTLRFKLKPSAVYFNPTEKCNLNCPYCYIPEKMRKDGEHMSFEKMSEAMVRLKDYFSGHLPKDRKPQIVFHGSEPLMNKDALFKVIFAFRDDFDFGIQTNATLLEDGDVEFLKENRVAVGISLDGHTAKISDRTRKNYQGAGTFPKIIDALEKFKGYDRFSVICTVTEENLDSLSDVVDFLHKHEVQSCLLNQVRCTLPKSRTIKPSDAKMAEGFIKALDRTHKLYKETGRKLTVVNFANIILGIVAPSARRLMCDISPCGGGRCFFAVAANGDMFPCSEFIGLPDFKGGNLFENHIPEVLESKPFKLVTERKVEDIKPCNTCAIRHFCGSPCPAEATEMNGCMQEPGAFCEFYEEQVRYAFRLIAEGIENDYLWDNWDKNTSLMFNFS